MEPGVAGERHLGVLLSPAPGRFAGLRPGIRFTGHTVLQIAGVVLGTQLSPAVAEVGIWSLPVMVGTLAICLGAAYLLGRALGVDTDLRTLIGVGTGICGASAIAVVKLTRTLMIVPVCLVLAAIVNRRQVGASTDGSARRVTQAIRLVPWFLAAFLGAAAANSAGWMSPALQAQLHTLATFLITAALSAIGLSTDFGGIRRAGARPLLLGLILWVLVTVSSLVLILLTT